jgi:GT2 family glycosyltransferase
VDLKGWGVVADGHRMSARTSTSRTVPAARQATVAEAGEHPPVSVVVATREREQLLLRALGAIVAQDYPGPIEIVVVRDGGWDEDAVQALTTAMAPLLGDRATLTQTPNARSAGLAGGRNTGIIAAGHPLVAFCDDDDEWLPGKLSAQVPMLLRTPAASVVATGISVVHDGVATDRPGPLRPTTFEDLLTRRVMELHPSTFLLRRADLLGPIGLVDEALPGGYAEDYDLLLRAAALGPVLSVPRPLVRVHWHGSSFYFSKWQTIHESLAALLAKHPQFAQVPRGHARVRGQQALALAAMGRRREALQAAAQTWRIAPGEPRAYLAAAVASRLLSIEGLQAQLHKRGRGL